MRLLSQRILAAKGVEPADQAKTALKVPTNDEPPTAPPATFPPQTIAQSSAPEC